MGEQRVGAQCPVHVEFDPRLGGPLGDRAEDLCGPFRPAELLRVGLDHRLRGARRGGRVELERAIGHVEIDTEVFAGEQFEPGFELALADVAPGTHDVGVDVDRDDWPG